MSINRVTSPNRSLLNNADGGRSGPGIVAIAATPPLLSLVTCSASQQRPIQAVRLQAACVDSRSQIFTMDYTPVCAKRRSGELKTCLSPARPVLMQTWFRITQQLEDKSKLL